MYKNILLKLSGEALKGDSADLYDFDLLKSLALEIKEARDLGVKVSIVVGGGNIWRGAVSLEKYGMKRTAGDRLGMMATIMNGIMLKEALMSEGVKTIVYSAVNLPTMVDTYNQDKVEETIEDHVHIYVGGTGHPFFTTDTASSLRAAQSNADAILMAKNGTDGVYDKDPNKYDDAKKYDELTMGQILTDNLEVIDLSAAAMCKAHNIEAVVFDMNVKGNILRAIKKENIGTKITN